MSLVLLLLAAAMGAPAPDSVGLNVHLPPADTLALAAEAGCSWIRIDFDWKDAEPSPGQRRFEPYDGVLEAARAHGLRVFATVGYTPAWASTGDRLADGPGNDVPDPGAFRRFVSAAAARYADGRVAAWGTWNEPNLPQFFEGTLEEWLSVVFVPTVDAVRRACPACAVVGPELASVGMEYDRYLAAALSARGAVLDAVSFHVYASFPEDDEAAGVTKDGFYDKLEAHREGRPLSLREVLLATGHAELPAWITEAGFSAAVGDATALEAQRRHLSRVLDAMSARPWWTRTFFYELVEEHPQGLWPDQHWGLALRTADAAEPEADHFLRKPAFHELRRRLTAGAAEAPPPAASR